MEPGKYEQLSAQLTDLKYELDMWRLQFYAPTDLYGTVDKINRLEDIKNTLKSDRLKSQSENLERLRQAMIKDIKQTQGLKYYREIEKKVKVTMSVMAMINSNIYRDRLALLNEVGQTIMMLSLTMEDFGEILNMNFSNKVNLNRDKDFKTDGEIVENSRIMLRGLYEDMLDDEDETKPFDIYEKIIMISILEEIKRDLEYGN